MTAHDDDARCGQRARDVPQVEEVERHLVDEARLRRPRGSRALDVVAAQRRQVDVRRLLERGHVQHSRRRRRGTPASAARRSSATRLQTPPVNGSTGCVRRASCRCAAGPRRRSVRGRPRRPAGPRPENRQHVRKETHHRVEQDFDPARTGSRWPRACVRCRPAGARRPRRRGRGPPAPSPAHDAGATRHRGRADRRPAAVRVARRDCARAFAAVSPRVPSARARSAARSAGTPRTPPRPRRSVPGTSVPQRD